MKKATLCCLLALGALLATLPFLAPNTLAEDQSGYTLFGSTPRPIKHFNVTTTDAGDNTIIEAAEGHTFLILACSVFSTHEMTDAVAFYIHSGNENLAGSPAGTFPIDKAGVEGYGGFVMGANTFGWMKTTTPNQAVSIHLSANQTVICIGTYIEL
jgi:hypothetical protein